MGMFFFLGGMFSDGLATAVVQGMMRRVVPHRGSVVPTTLALCSFGFHYRNLEVRGLRHIMGFFQFDLRYDKEAGQVPLIVLEEFIFFGIGLDDHFGFERGANQLVGPEQAGSLPKVIAAAAQQSGKTKWDRAAYGDGHAAERIARSVAQRF